MALAGVAVTHLLDLPHKLVEAPYLGVLFEGLIAASVGLGLVMLAGRWLRAAWGAAATLSAFTIIGYVESRTVGLPQISHHIGMWADPAGIVSLVCEATLVGVGTWLCRSERGEALLTDRRRAANRPPGRAADERRL